MGTYVPGDVTGGAEVAKREYAVLMSALADVPASRVTVAITWDSKDAAARGWSEAVDQLAIADTWHRTQGAHE